MGIKVESSPSSSLHSSSDGEDLLRSSLDRIHRSLSPNNLAPIASSIFSSSCSSSPALSGSGYFSAVSDESVFDFGQYETDEIARAEKEIKRITEGLEVAAKDLTENQLKKAVSEFNQIKPELAFVAPNRDHPFPDMRGYWHSRSTTIAGNVVSCKTEDEQEEIKAMLHQMPLKEPRKHCQATAEAVLDSLIEHNAPVIACLASTEETERNEHKACQKYWELATLIKEEVIEHSGTSQKLYIRHLKYKEHTFIQLHLDLWKDEGEDPDPELFFMFIKKLYELTNDHPGLPHIHCAAGVNRSRFAFCMLLIYIQLLKNPDSEINVARLLLTTHLNRPHFFSKVARWLVIYYLLMADQIQESKK